MCSGTGLVPPLVFSSSLSSIIVSPPLGRSPPHAPTHDANGPDGGLGPLQSPPSLKFLPEGRPSSRFCPWFLDVDGSEAAGGSMIRHAPEAALCPVDPLPIPVIEPSFRAVLVFPVGDPRLLAPHPATAPLSAVDLPPVAASADVKHRPATRPSAKQLDPCHFAGHTPHDSIAACEPCRVGGDAGGIDLGLGGVREWAERIGRKYER